MMAHKRTEKEPVLRPIWGFGRAGGIALGIGALLVVAALRIDLFYLLQKYLAERSAVDAPVRVALIYAIVMYIVELPGFAPVGAALTAIVLHLSPSPLRAWKWFLLLAWIVIELWLGTFLYMRGARAALALFVAPSEWPIIAASATGTVIFLLALVRWWPVIPLVALGCGMVWGIGALWWHMDWPHGPYMPPFSLYALMMGFAWNLPVFAGLFWWALRERRRAVSMVYCCSACGYDLRGLAEGAPMCPECGVARSQGKAAAAHPAAGVG